MTLSIYDYVNWTLWRAVREKVRWLTVLLKLCNLACTTLWANQPSSQLHIQCVSVPYLCTNLVATLANLYAYNFTHFAEFLRFVATEMQEANISSQSLHVFGTEFSRMTPQYSRNMHQRSANQCCTHQMALSYNMYTTPPGDKSSFRTATHCNVFVSDCLVMFQTVHLSNGFCFCLFWNLTLHSNHIVKSPHCVFSYRIIIMYIAHALLWIPCLHRNMGQRVGLCDIKPVLLEFWKYS